MINVKVVLLLNERQRRFADEYIRTGNIYQSAIIAGYSENYAKADVNKILENPIVKAYIDKRLGDLKKQSIAEQDEILQFLTSVVRGEAKGKLKVGTGGGAEEVKDIAPSLQERIKAAEQLGKRYGMWTDKHEVEHKLPKFIDDIVDDDD